MADGNAKLEIDRHLTEINRSFQTINTSIVNLRTFANDKQSETLDVFQARIYEIQHTESDNVRSAFS